MTEYISRTCMDICWTGVIYCNTQKGIRQVSSTVSSGLKTYFAYSYRGGKKCDAANWSEETVQVQQIRSGRYGNILPFRICKVIKVPWPTSLCLLGFISCLLPWAKTQQILSHLTWNKTNYLYLMLKTTTWTETKNTWSVKSHYKHLFSTQAIFFHLCSSTFEYQHPLMRLHLIM